MFLFTITVTSITYKTSILELVFNERYILEVC